MRMRWNAFVVPAVFWAAFSAAPEILRADDMVKTNATQCRASTANEVLRCAMKHNPELQAATVELKRYAAEVDRAKQNPNPELGSRVLGGPDSFTAEASFEHTFETAGKRAARMDVAEQNLALARSRLELRRMEIVIESALRLHSLRHLADEIGHLREAERAFGNAVSKYSRRPALSGEQQASRASYEVALARVRMRIDHLNAERDRLVIELRYATGLPATDFAQVAASIPEPRWPVAATLQEPPTEDKAAELRLARERVARARAAMQQEDAEAYPNLSIGPALEYRRGRIPSGGIFGGSTSSSEAELGLSFRMTLPLYHTNEGGRDAARAAVAAEQARAASVQDRLQLERDRLLREYTGARRALQRSLSFAALEIQHRQVRAAIARGRVSAATVIEFHRGMIEYVHEYHEREDAALLALLSIYVIDGRLLSEVEGDGIF